MDCASLNRRSSTGMRRSAAVPEKITWRFEAPLIWRGDGAVQMTDVLLWPSLPTHGCDRSGKPGRYTGSSNHLAFLRDLGSFPATAFASAAGCSLCSARAQHAQAMRAVLLAKCDQRFVVTRAWSKSIAPILHVLGAGEHGGLSVPDQNGSGTVNELDVREVAVTSVWPMPRWQSGFRLDDRGIGWERSRRASTCSEQCHGPDKKCCPSSTAAINGGGGTG